MKPLEIRCTSLITTFLKIYFQAQAIASKFEVLVAAHGVKFLIIKPTRCTNFSNLFLE